LKINSRGVTAVRIGTGLSVKIKSTRNGCIGIIRSIISNKYTYIMLIPGVLFYLIFAYGPMYGITLAFKEFVISEGITGSPWVGLKNFEKLFSEKQFWDAFKNTIIISFGRLFFGFPAPIILAILVNEIRMKKYKKVLQTVFTFPHFLSWIIISGMIMNIFSSTGAINNLLGLLGFETQAFLANPGLIRPLLYSTDIWKSSGWSSIIYLAAISGVDLEQYEAATIDGANRFQRILHVTWPGMKPTAVLLLVLSVGGVMNAGFDQIFNLYNPTLYETADIIDTFVYRMTFQRPPDYGFSTALGLFKAIINFVLLLSADRFAKILGERGIF